MKDVRVIKIDVGSPTDKALSRIQKNISASSISETVRRSLAVADYITNAQSKGRKVLIETENGAYQELILG